MSIEDLNEEQERAETFGECADCDEPITAEEFHDNGGLCEVCAEEQRQAKPEDLDYEGVAL